MRIVRFARTDGPTYGIVEEGGVAVIEPHPFAPHAPTGEVVPLEGLRLLAPVVPSKIVCVGRNYRDHAAELGGDVPTEPLLFLKPSTAVIGPGEPIRYPTGATNEVHHEAELAVVIGGLLRDATTEQAAGGIYGFTAANDVTARDLQREDGQWTRAKGFDSFCPLGPAISTEIDPADTSIRCYVDDELRQDGTTADMVFDVPTLVGYISRIMTLLPGDVVLTGTPAGVGPIEPGQVVRVEIDGIGRLENPVIHRTAVRPGNGEVSDDA
jgi:2-keto-4-pentenoate hydratase/2-oxohepta-3-ene-1,7-dioic acid hydratase in catechol pathway